MKTGLLLIDIQNDYFPGGKMEVIGSNEASENAKKILNGFRGNKLPVFHIQHISIRPGSTFFLPDTAGINIHQNVLPLSNEAVIQKNYPNSFRDTDLLDALKKEGIISLVICGMMTHMCVDATTRAAFDNGFNCTLIYDACATRDLVFNSKKIPAEYVQNSFLAALNGVYAKVIDTNELMNHI